MAGHSFITYKGKDISYLDHQGEKLEQMIQTVKDAEERALKKNKRIYVLTNMTGAFAVPDYMKRAKEAGKNTNHLIIKQALVGITTGQKILATAYSLFTKNKIKVFDDEESAKEWFLKD